MAIIFELACHVSFLYWAKMLLGGGGGGDSSGYNELMRFGSRWVGHCHYSLQTHQVAPAFSQVHNLMWQVMKIVV